MHNDNPVILFDGVCNFCNGAINFVLKQDKKDNFRFAPLQSEVGQKLLQEYNLSTKEFDSFVLIDNGKVYKKICCFIKSYEQAALVLESSTNIENYSDCF